MAQIQTIRFRDGSIKKFIVRQVNTPWEAIYEVATILHISFEDAGRNWGDVVWKEDAWEVCRSK